MFAAVRPCLAFRDKSFSAAVRKRVPRLLDVFERAFGSDFNLHLLAHPEHEFTRILHSPGDVGDGKLRGCRDHPGGNLHL